MSVAVATAATTIALPLALIASGCGSQRAAPLPAKAALPAPRETRLCGPESDRTERINVGRHGREAHAPTFRPSVTANARFVVFSSRASRLVPGDRNRVADVFVRDRRLGRTRRVSLSSTGAEANGASHAASITADGRLVAFRSVATNLVRNDGNGTEDVFVRDLRSGRTRRVDVAAEGEEANGAALAAGISADGRVVAFTSAASNLVAGDWNGVPDVFVRELVRGRTIRVSVAAGGVEANRPSDAISVSGHGTLVAFRSYAWNLVAHDDNGVADVFVRDLRRHVTRRVTTSPAGVEADATTFRGMLSAGGRYVGFRSRASNLVSGDTNDALDVFVRDRATGRTRRISVSTSGEQADARRFSEYERDNRFMSRPFLSADGRYAAFTSRAANLVPGDTNGAPDVFRHDLRTGRTVRVSLANDGRQANSGSFAAGISADGRVVLFQSFANDLVAGDTNRRRDVFVRVLAPPCRPR